MFVLPLRFIWFAIFLCSAWASWAQVYTSPKNYKPGMQQHVVLASTDDAQYMRKNIKKFFGLSLIRIEGVADISACSQIIQILDGLEQIELVSFSGQLLDEDLERLDWAGDVSVYVANGNEDHILNTDYLSKLQSVTLQFEIVPNDWTFLHSWRCRSLKLVAPFVQQEVPAAVQAAVKMRNLYNFGISVDKVQHIPKTITQIKKLQTLTIIDNLSWISQKYLTNLSLSRFNIEQSINNGEFTKYIGIEYYADEPTLTDYDENYLLSLFTNSKIVPFMNNSSDSSEYAGFATYIPLQSIESVNFRPIFPDKHLLKNYSETDFFFSGSNQQDRVYYIKDYAAIFIPKNSLKTATDSVYIGEYSLKVSWSNKERQFFAQSNTMAFDSSNRSYSLAPTGLLEIQAQAGTKELSIRPGYFFKIVFEGDIDTSDRFYAYNMAKNKWDNYWDYDYEFEDAKNQVIDFYQFYAGKKIATQVSTLSRMDVRNHFETQGYSYHLPYDMARMHLEKQGKWFLPKNTPDPKSAQYSLRRGRKYVGVSRYGNTKYDGLIPLNVYDRTEVLFPELKALRNVPLSIKTDIDRKQFSSIFLSKKRYNDIRIEQIGSEYYLDLKLDDGYWHLALTSPNRLDNKLISQKKYSKAIAKYDKCREERMLKWQDAMLAQESAITEKAIENLFRDKSDKKVAEFRIRSTGAFAWAHPVMSNDTFSVIIQATDAGVPLNCKRLVVAQGNPFTYQTYKSRSTYSISVDINKLQYIACEDELGQVYYLTGRQFKSMGIQNNTYIQLPLNHLPQPVSSPQDLNKIFNFKK
jgi:hypothetical protein